MQILNRHLYRTSTPEEEDNVVIRIPHSELLQVIKVHTEEGMRQEIRSKKRKQGEEEAESFVKQSARKVVQRFMKKSKPGV